MSLLSTFYETRERLSCLKQRVTNIGTISINYLYLFLNNFQNNCEFDMCNHYILLLLLKCFGNLSFDLSMNQCKRLLCKVVFICKVVCLYTDTYTDICSHLKNTEICL